MSMACLLRGSLSALSKGLRPSCLKQSLNIQQCHAHYLYNQSFRSISHQFTFNCASTIAVAQDQLLEDGNSNVVKAQPEASDKESRKISQKNSQKKTSSFYHKKNFVQHCKTVLEKRK